MRPLLLAGFLGGLALSAAAQPAVRWWRGNLHTHTLWSDGDDFPEMVVEAYKTKGYDFLALSDHNVLQQGEVWALATSNSVARRALPRYLRRFGSNWVEQATHEGKPVVRLKTLEEFRGQFEAPGRFLLIQAEEVTDRFSRWPLHLIAANLHELIKPQGGSSPVEVMQRNLDALAAQRDRLGVPMMIHLAHPNFGWAVTAEDMLQLRGNRFFEVYNGHPSVHNEGDAIHAGTERMWDIVNTHRIAERRDVPLLGLAVDDAHHYTKQGSNHANVARGWVMVRAHQLSAGAIIGALEAGDFYSSTGVELSDVSWRDNRLTVRVAPQPGATYTVEFVGTRRPVNWNSRPVTDAAGRALAVTRLYDAGLGAVLATVPGTNASYTCRGDELYVRARVTSSRRKENGIIPGEREMAWTQPVPPVRQP